MNQSDHPSFIFNKHWTTLALRSMIIRLSNQLSCESNLHRQMARMCQWIQNMNWNKRFLDCDHKSDVSFKRDWWRQNRLLMNLSFRFLRNCVTARSSGFWVRFCSRVVSISRQLEAESARMINWQILCAAFAVHFRWTACIALSNDSGDLNECKLMTGY